jgi:membrane protease YdiL (CAAX protease family)
MCIEANARTRAMIALAVFGVFRGLTATLLHLGETSTILEEFPALAIAEVVFMWGIPFVIVYRLERRDARSLGLDISQRRFFWFVLFGIVALLSPALVGWRDGALPELAEQVAYIGVAEELFFRGYLMTRLCSWLGDYRGLVTNGLIFGLTHVVSLLSMGVLTPSRLALVGLQTFLGGLLLGYIYLKSRSIVPAAVFHTFMNTYV